MRVIKAGWGEPPANVTYDVAANTSRLLARAKCGELHGYVYEDRRVPARDTSQALHLGTVWHAALEHLSRGLGPNQVLAKFAGEEWIAKDDGSTEQPWFEAALRAYDEHHGGTYPCGEILATEVPFWMVVYAPDQHVLLRGRIDRLCNWHGSLVNGEIKTAAAGTKMDSWLALRSVHPQDAIYYLAMVHAGRVLPNGSWLPDEVYGTRYDVTLKYTVPKGRRKDKSDLPGLLQAWKDKLFYDDGVLWTEKRALAIAGKAVSDYLALAGIRHRNLAACDAYGRCAYFDVCHRGLSLGSLEFTDREADYVDEL